MCSISPLSSKGIPFSYVYSNGTIEDWWPTRLLHDGYRLQLLARQGNHVMYLVELETPHSVASRNPATSRANGGGLPHSEIWSHQP